MEVNINSSNFEKEVIEYKGTVIVDFYGSWCMPCKMIAPIVEKVVADNNFKLAKIDVDDNFSNNNLLLSKPILTFNF